MKNKKEIWKDVEGYKRIYQVSNLGEIKSLERYVNHRKDNALRKEKKLKPCLRSGYPSVVLCVKNDKYHFTIHRLVAIAFIPNPENKPEVNHINGVKTDNRVENLEWCTHKENNNHAFRIGLKVAKSGENHYMFGRSGEKHKLSKLTEKDVLEIRAIGKTKTLCQLSKIYNVSITTISKALNKKIWKYI